MSTVTQDRYTLQDLAMRTHNGTVLDIAETLTRKNQFLLDAVFQEANDPTTHTYLTDASLPTGSWVNINDGVNPEKYIAVQGKETMGIMESLSRVDTRLVDIAQDQRLFRATQDKKYVEGMGQTLAKAFFQGSTTTNPASINGLMNRSFWNALAQTGYVTAGGGTANRSSIWVVEWDPTSMYLVYPKGHPHVGIKAQDMGIQPQVGANGGRYYAYETKFSIACGIVPADPRCVQRYANINAGIDSGTGAFSEVLLASTIGRLPSFGDTSKTIIYVNRDIYNAIQKRAMGMTNMQYSNAEDTFGKKIVTFRGIPIRMIESLDTGNALETVA